VQADSLEILWLLAHGKKSILSHEELMEISPDNRDTLLRLQLLEERCPSYIIECDNCYQGYADEVRWINYPDGQRRLYLACPKCGAVLINPSSLRRWGVNYNKIIEVIYKGLKCRGKPKPVMDGTFWHIGAASLAGQARPVWLARKITAVTKEMMPKGKLPIVFKMFPGQYQVDNFDSDKIFELSELFSIKNGKIKLDVDTIKRQLGYVVKAQTPAPRAVRKDAKRAAVIKAAKKELHKHILSMKSLLANSDTKLPRLRQKQLAKSLNASEAMISNILNKEPDELLKILWETANNPDKIREYSRKQG
jgi:hypothetical protein